MPTYLYTQPLFPSLLGIFSISEACLFPILDDYIVPPHPLGCRSKNSYSFWLSPSTRMEIRELALILVYSYSICRSLSDCLSNGPSSYQHPSFASCVGLLIVLRISSPTVSQNRRFSETFTGSTAKRPSSFVYPGRDRSLTLGLALGMLWCCWSVVLML